jgi:hypothetical protein
VKQCVGHPIALRLAILVAASAPILALDAHAGERPEIVISQFTRTPDVATSRVDEGWADTRLRAELDVRLSERYAISRIDTCDEMDQPCSLARARRGHATYLVRVTLSTEAADHRVRVEVVRPSDGYTAAVVDDTCEICGRAELDDFFTDVVGTLIVRLDGLTRPAPPEQARAVPPTRARSPALRIAGVTTLSVGAATGIAGAVLWGLDGRPHRGSCGDPDARGECPNVYSSRPGGIALTATGLTALGVGAALLVIDGVRRKRTSSSADVRAKWTGAGLQWSF